MKFRIRLLKAWTDESGIEFAAGDILEIDSKALYGELLADEIAEKAPEQKSAPEMDEKAIDAALEKALAPIKEKIAHIEVHDKSDDDESWGYGPEVAGRERTQDEKLYGLGLFAKDVALAEDRSKRLPDRLSKCRERSEKMIQKAAGDGVTVGTDSELGFLAPPEFSMMLNDQSVQQSIMRPIASIVQMQRETLRLPQTKNYDHSSNLIYGGLLAYWKAEEAQLSEAKPSMEEIGLNLHKLTALAYASGEIVKFSSIALGSYLLPKMGDAIAWKEDDAFINGTGAGMPLGILNSPSKVSIAIETGQDLTPAFVAANIDKMYAALRVEKAANVRWFYNKADGYPHLAALARTVGTGGSAAGLATSMIDAPTMRLAGIPLVSNEHCQALGTVGDLILLDGSQYLIGDDRTGPQIATSIHLKFDYDQEAYRIIKYVDGTPRYTAAFSGQNATQDTAPVVTLDARSA